MPRQSLSELECFVLGLVWQIGPCSAYELRRHMQSSPSTQWSGSAGAVYPLVQRLERQKLLKGQSRRTGRRARREFSITSSGLARLRAWVGPPFAPEVVTVTYWARCRPSKESRGFAEHDPCSTVSRKSCDCGTCNMTRCCPMLPKPWRAARSWSCMREDSGSKRSNDHFWTARTPRGTHLTMPSSDEELRKALKAFRKRLRLNQLEEDSRLGRSPREIARK